MIPEFINRFMERKQEIAIEFSKKHPEQYIDIVNAVVRALHDPNNSYGTLDPDRVYQINDGGYHGTLVFVVAVGGRDPSDYYYVMVDYGSSRGCDILESIRMDTNGKPTDEQVKDYVTLALHIVQGLKKM